MGSFPEMFNSFCGLWRWGLVMCAGSLYSYIQDYNRRESFSFFLLNNLSDMYSFKAILKEISSVKNSGIAGWPKSQ